MIAIWNSPLSMTKVRMLSHSRVVASRGADGLIPKPTNEFTTYILRTGATGSLVGLSGSAYAAPPRLFDSDQRCVGG